MKPAVAIIGGTGVYQEEIFSDIKEFSVSNKYGTVNIKSAKYDDQEIIFLERHGKRHSIAPHKINYRANIYALKELKVERIIATAAVGAINTKYRPGDFVIIDDFIDFTKSRLSTFFDEPGRVVHIDMSEPYCKELRECILKSGQKIGLKLHDGGTYICTEGPRFETKAEIRAYSILGADVVGMTNVPEIVLAKEMGMCYATIALITNYAASISIEPLSHKEVIDTMQSMSDNLRKLLLKLIQDLPDVRSCLCKYSTKELGSLK